MASVWGQCYGPTGALVIGGFAQRMQQKGGIPHNFQDQGWIFAAFNAGLLCMLLTGFMADKFNAKCSCNTNKHLIKGIVPFQI